MHKIYASKCKQKTVNFIDYGALPSVECSCFYSLLTVFQLFIADLFLIIIFIVIIIISSTLLTFHPSDTISFCAHGIRTHIACINLSQSMQFLRCFFLVIRIDVAAFYFAFVFICTKIRKKDLEKVVVCLCICLCLCLCHYHCHHISIRIAVCMLINK